VEKSRSGTSLKGESGAKRREASVERSGTSLKGESGAKWNESERRVWSEVERV